jgi:transposase
MITPYPLRAPPRNLRVLDKYPLGEPLGAPQAVRRATALRRTQVRLGSLVPRITSGMSSWLAGRTQKFRCSACGQVFTADAPAKAGVDKYSPRARAVLVLGRYYLGGPLYRLEGYQAMVGVPVADATQWDQIERVADCAYPVFAQLQTLAAQGEVIYQDDTHVRILSLIAENRRTQADDTSGARTGMYTTGLVVQQGEHMICLYMAGRAHAGENLEALLTQRDAGRDKPLVMSDA